MKIISGQYKEEPAIEGWLKFKSSDYRYCNLVFLRRLAALCRDFSHGMSGLIGYRDVALQKALYDADLKANGGKPSGKVARPGDSWHTTGLLSISTKITGIQFPNTSGCAIQGGSRGLTYMD